MNNDLLTTKQASVILGISKYSLDNSRCSGKLMGTTPPAHIKFGYAVRYRRETLNAWLSALNESVTMKGGF